MPSERRWGRLKAFPNPTKAGLYIAHGQATVGSDALGRPPEPTSRCKCKSFSRGQRPRYVKMYALNHRPPGALPPFHTFALTARCGLTALPRVSLTSFALPWAMNSPSCGGRGMAFSHPPLKHRCSRYRSQHLSTTQIRNL